MLLQNKVKVLLGSVKVIYYICDMEDRGMYKRIKVRLYPTVKHKRVLENHFNAFRFVYNLSLEYKKTMWEQWKMNKSGYDIAKEVLELRKEIPWLLECKAECVREGAYQLDKAYKNFFKGNSFPKFKSKRGEQSFHAYQAINCKGSRLNFYKQKIKFKTSDRYVELLNTNKIKQVTFKRDKCGDYWATCLIEIPDVETLPSNNRSVGIDLGIKDLVITSEGVVYENKKYFTNTQKKLKRIQRKISKTKKGGKNREKLRKKIAKTYRKITRQREHYYHSISNDLIRENQTIVLETLKIKNMVKNRNLAKAISDASWGTLIKMLEYKAKWYGRNIIKIDTFYPSSKTCSNCGNVKKELKLSERTYKCECCGFSIDRDLNASINIRNAGLKIPEVPVEELTMVSPLKQEVTD